MSSRDKEQTTPHHQPLLSSLVVRPSVSDGGGDGGGGRGAGSDYEPGEVRRDPPLYYRSDRYPDEPGYRARAGSASPVRRRDADSRYDPEFDRSGGMPRGRDFGSGRDSDRYRDLSPPYARPRGGGRAFGRGLAGPAFGSGPFRGEGMGRNNPNVRPREGDWFCPDPLCNNLNFARREYCNNCRRHRYAPPGGSPRRGYPGPPPPLPPRRFPGPPLDLSPGRAMNGGYRSPPRGWVGGPPHSRHEGRFNDHIRRDRPDFPDDDFRGRKPMPPMEWGHRDRGRDNLFNGRKGYDRRPLSPPSAPSLPHRDRWARDRSRSPMRGGPPPKDYRRDIYADRGRDDRRGGYAERGRDDRRGLARDRVGDAF